MAEIERVNSAINGFFDSSGEEHIESLGQAMERCLMATERRYMELNMDDECVTGTLITHQGEIVHDRVRKAMGLEPLVAPQGSPA